MQLEVKANIYKIKETCRNSLVNKIKKLKIKLNKNKK